MTDYEIWMELALSEARSALTHDDVPVGAVVVDSSGSVIGSAHNERELTGDPTAHAEILAIRAAASKLGTWRLENCTLVVTLEPCPMCAGAAWAARVGGVVYGATDPKAGALGTLFDIHSDARLNHRFSVTPGVMAQECGQILRDFFGVRRS